MIQGVDSVSMGNLSGTPYSVLLPLRQKTPSQFGLEKWDLYLWQLFTKLKKNSLLYKVPATHEKTGLSHQVYVQGEPMAISAAPSNQQNSTIQTQHQYRSSCFFQTRDIYVLPQDNAKERHAIIYMFTSVMNFNGNMKQCNNGLYLDLK